MNLKKKIFIFVYLILNVFSLNDCLNILKNNETFKSNEIKTQLKKKTSLPEPILKLMASRPMRIHHFMFHTTRDEWNSFDNQTKEALNKIGWSVIRPSKDSKGIPICNNTSGEDFLYMHKHMINLFNEILAQGDFEYGKKLNGWKEIPEPDDLDFPVPQPYFTSVFDNQFINMTKTNDYFYKELKPACNLIKSPEFLKNISLERLGCILEYEIHNPMHARWSDQKCSERKVNKPFYNLEAIDKIWDDISYDCLVDFYASHVNYVFWKIHAWIETVINDWQIFNNIKEIQWNGKWMANMPKVHL